MERRKRNQKDSDFKRTPSNPSFLSPVFNPAERRSYYSAQEEKVTAASMN
jgi:hypothetical protein